MTETPATIGELFRRDPTRELEEVQKVNAIEKAENDIDEFHETPSASEVLFNLGALVERRPVQDPRFLYLYATFGSGKTHLLKLIGFATGEMGPHPEALAKRLAHQFEGFAEFRDKLSESHMDHLVPVFLNLLDRDPSREPPLPMVIYEALGRELGFPTDPDWLLEWVWDLETNRAPGLWSSIQRYDDSAFDEALEDRGTIRSWLYETLPDMAEGREAGFTDAEAVRRSIETAESRMDPERFGPDDLVERIEQATSYLSEKLGGKTELLLGLDEVALFVGDSQERYEEFLETVQAVINGPNPVVVGTGQWPPQDIHESSFTESDPPSWFLNSVKLQGADTETIVRNRWLRKSPTGRKAVADLLGKSWLKSLDVEGDMELPDLDAVESYPFREYDLWLLRGIMQNLLGRGLPTEHEHIQGRALLVVVRALFTRYGWVDESVGSIVPWNQIFDLLAADEALIPGWAIDLVDRIDDTLGGKTPLVTETAKVLFVLNRADRVPATARNIARLLADTSDTDIGDVEGEIVSAVSALERDNYLYEVDEHYGEPVYELLSREEVTLQEKIGRREVPRPELRGKIQTWLQEHPSLLAEGRRHELDLGGERKVPIRYEYSILRGVQRPTTPPYDAVGVRILTDYGDVEDKVEQWRELADERGGEDLLIALNLSEGYLDRLGRMIAVKDVLKHETRRYPELEASVREDEHDLEQRLNQKLREAEIITPSGESLGTFGDSFDGAVIDRVVRSTRDPKFPDRKVLQKGLQEIGDAKALHRFFKGDAPWPLDRVDAEMLGVNTATRELENGWTEEFLETYGEETIVGGETLLDQIQERGGNYLGSPLESLAALLLTLSTARKVELRRDGRPLREPGEMGRALRTKEDLRKIEVRMEPPVDRSKVDTLRSVHQALLGTGTSPEDPDDMVHEVAMWTRENSRLLREIDQQLAREFSGEIDLEQLRGSLQPALEGEDLDQSSLTEEAVEAQAKRFAKARALFQGEERETWNRFHEATDILNRNYPRENLTYRFQQVEGRDELPEPSRLKSMVEEAVQLRSDHLTRIYRGITGNSPPTDDPDEIPGTLSDWLKEEGDEVEEQLNEADDRFQPEFPLVHEALSRAREGERLEESDLTGSGLEEEVRNLERGRKLLEERDGTTLWEQLEEVHRELKESHPEGAVTARIGRVLESTSLPEVETVQQLLEAAEEPEDGAPPEPGIEALWQKIEKLEPGTIAMIDPKEETE